MAPPPKPWLKEQDVDGIAKAVLGYTMKELIAKDRPYEEWEKEDLGSKLTDDMLKTLRRSIKHHDCRTLFKEGKRDNGDVMTIMRAAFKQVNYRLRAYMRSNKRYYSLAKNEEHDMKLRIQDVGKQGKKKEPEPIIEASDDE